MSIKELLDNCEDYCEPALKTVFNWSKKGKGFGQIYFYIKDNEVRCENECESKEFIKEMLCKMVDECILDDPRDDEKS